MNDSRVVSGTARRFRPTARDIDLLRKYGASDGFIAAIQAPEQGDESTYVESGKYDSYRRARWLRVAFFSSALSAIPAGVVLIALPELLERGSPLIWLAILVSAPLSFQAMLLLVYATGWAVFHVLLARGIDRTYSTIEMIANFMPVRAAVAYRAAKVQAAAEISRPGADAKGSNDAQAQFRAGLRATARGSVAEAWRDSREQRSPAQRRSHTVGLVAATLSGVASTCVVLLVATSYLLSIDNAARIGELLALQIGIAGGLTTVVSVVLYSR